MAEPERHQRFVELLTQHQGQVFGYIYALVRNFDDAEDLFQQSSLVLWDKFDQFADGTNFVRWACTIAQYEVLNFIRKRQRNQLYFSEQFQRELAVMQSEMDADEAAARRDALAGCLERLDEGDRQLVQQCYGSNRSFKDVAACLGRPAQFIYDALSRIRRVLLNCVKLSLARERHP